MEVIIRPTTESAVRLTAKIIADKVNKDPAAVLGLATGRTMEAVYAELADMNHKGLVDFSKSTSFNLDEYIGIPATNENSYRYYMNKHLFSKINIDINRTNLPDGMAADVEAEGARYEAAIKMAGGVDIQLLGIGSDGHIAFNEPMSSLSSRTRAKSLTPETYAQNSPLFTNGDTMPMRAFTMGVGTIMDAREVVLLATGAGKAGIIAKAIEGPVCAMVTASALQYHPKAVVICDEAAAAELTQKEYYNWVFTHEPKWKNYQNI